MKYIPEILANLWVAFLNVAYMGEGVDSICRFEASAAQRLVWKQLMLQSRGFLTEGQRVGPDGYHASAEVLSLGTRSAIPDTAGVVDTVEVLSEQFPDLSALCADPDLILKDHLPFE
eukprot:12475031-Heterocapsa_arctica.AAC.1